MKIVYGCYPSIFSLLVVNILIKKYALPITNLLISNRPIKIDGNSTSTIKGAIYAYKRLRFKFLRFHILLSTLGLLFLKLKYICAGKNKIMSFKQICKAYGIKLIFSDDFNSPQTMKMMEGSDLFISMCLDQILNDHFIRLFNGNCINIHPSDLPDFRGLDPIFQFLLSPESEMGITLHYMSPKIDVGKIVLKRFISRGDSYLHLMKQFVCIGCEMIAQFASSKVLAEEIVENDSSRPVKYPYKSWPTEDEFRRFELQSCYFTLRDLVIWNIY